MEGPAVLKIGLRLPPAFFVVPPNTKGPEWYPDNVQITLNIPDDLALRLMAGDKDPAQATLEVLAVEGYRT